VLAHAAIEYAFRERMTVVAEVEHVGLTGSLDAVAACDACTQVGYISPADAERGTS
jgi:hypothetical protein